MKQKNSHYDVIFTTDIAVIGLVFDGSKLINVDYLNQKTEQWQQWHKEVP